MAVLAWPPVCLYRLSLGRQDKLQDAIRCIRTRSGLPLNSKPQEVREHLQRSPAAQSDLEFLPRYVPTRFLTPWFADRLRGVPDFQRSAKIQDLAGQSQGTPLACPYWLGDGEINVNESWRLFFCENAAVVRAFAEYHLARYLQARNPNVPGVINKLTVPLSRQLSAATSLWRTVRAEMDQRGRLGEFVDIYTGHPLPERYSIDHFLPWSFVAHDLLWNLTPVEPATNSSKGDPKANQVILGDFNEGKPVGSEEQAPSVLFQSKPPMVDALSSLSGRISTHTDGKAYDRILVSEAIAKGQGGLKLEGVLIQSHRHGKGDERRLYTDHFPVIAALRLDRQCGINGRLSGLT